MERGEMSPSSGELSSDVTLRRGNDDVKILRGVLGAFISKVV